MTGTRGRVPRLTAREWAVVKMMKEGCLPSLIAAELAISDKAVSHCVTAIAQKLQKDNRVMLQKLLVDVGQHAAQLQYPTDAQRFSKVTPHAVDGLAETNAQASG